MRLVIRCAGGSAALVALSPLRGPLALAASGCADAATADHRRAPREAARRDPRKLLLAPVTQSAAQETGLDSQGLAHRFERKRPFAALAAQPVFRLGEQPLARASLGGRVVLEATQRVLKDRHHQLLHRTNCTVVLTAVVELFRRQNVRYE